jgi:hypothetical protein
MEIAQTILDQMGGANRLYTMIGARHMVALDGIGGLQFSFSGCRSANKLVIRLNGLDLYDMTFWNVKRNGECIQVSESCNVYADQLQDIFIADTGLDLRIA